MKTRNKLYTVTTYWVCTKTSWECLGENLAKAKVAMSQLKRQKKVSDDQRLESRTATINGSIYLGLQIEKL